MPFDQVLTYIPVAAVVGGLLLVLWSERGRLQSLLPSERTPAPTATGLTPADRFAKFYALRNWCEQAGAAEAVKALDGVVLPAIVQGGKPS
jgi:hypothetical protein